MTQDEHGSIDQPTASQWMQASVLSAFLGGGILIVGALAMLSVPNETESDIVERIAAAGMILLAFALPALYASERGWFGRLAKGGFWLMAVGWTIASIAAVVTAYTMPPVSEMAFVVLLVTLLVGLIGAFTFGVAVLRSDTARAPRLGSWLLVAAIPVGLPFTVGFTLYVMGELAEPWAGPLLCYGLAWIVFGRYLWSRWTGRAVIGATPQSQ